MQLKVQAARRANLTLDGKPYDFVVNPETDLIMDDPPWSNEPRSVLRAAFNWLDEQGYREFEHYSVYYQTYVPATDRRPGRSQRAVIRFNDPNQAVLLKMFVDLWA